MGKKKHIIIYSEPPKEEIPIPGEAEGILFESISKEDKKGKSKEIEAILPPFLKLFKKGKKSKSILTQIMKIFQK
ncbi:MAG: hypothetical protein QW735_00775 [archaeon]